MSNLNKKNNNIKSLHKKEKKIVKKGIVKAERMAIRGHGDYTMPGETRSMRFGGRARGQIAGHGDYTLPSREEGRLAQFGNQSWGGALGGAIGKFIPGAEGPLSWLGSKAHQLFKSITGWGNYRLRAKAFHEHMVANDHTTDIDTILAGTVPRFGSNSTETILKYREFVAPVLGSTGLITTTYAVNPGLSATTTPVGVYSWLANIAPNWQQFEIVGQVFEYRSRSDVVVGTSGAAGLVYMSSTYNPTLLPLATELQIADNEYTTSDKPENNFYHMLECDRKQEAVSVYDVRITALPTNADLRLSDPCFMQVTTVGQQTDGQRLGDIYVTYSVRLIKPCIPVVGGGAPAIVPWFHARGFAQTSASHLLPMTSSMVNASSNLPIVMATPANDNIGLVCTALPIGNYFMVYDMTVFATSPQGSYTGAPIIVFTPSVGSATSISLLPSSTGSDTIWQSGDAMQVTYGGGGSHVLTTFAVTATFSGLITIVHATTLVGGATPAPDAVYVMAMPPIVDAPKLVPSRMVEDPQSRAIRLRLEHLESTSSSTTGKTIDLTMTLLDQLHDLREEVYHLKHKDTELFDDDDPSSTRVVTPVLSSSLLGVVSEYVSRKSNSNKK